MREHVRDPGHMPEVIMSNGWDAMRWERLAGADWSFDVIDTSRRAAADVAADSLAWVRAARSCPWRARLQRCADAGAARARRLRALAARSGGRRPRDLQCVHLGPSRRPAPSRYPLDRAHDGPAVLRRSRARLRAERRLKVTVEERVPVRFLTPSACGAELIAGAHAASTRARSSSSPRRRQTTRRDGSADALIVQASNHVACRHRRAPCRCWRKDPRPRHLAPAVARPRRHGRSGRRRALRSPPARRLW